MSRSLSLIVAFMKDGKHLCKNTKTLSGADCGSDQELLMMSMRLKIRKTKSAEDPICYDMMHIPEDINVDIENRFC